VERYERVTVQAYDEAGQKMEYGASGSMAQIFQHEIDHLDGILFVDKVKKLRTYEKEDTHEEK